jgi:hypothetical protein
VKIVLRRIYAESTHGFFSTQNLRRIYAWLFFLRRIYAESTHGFFFYAESTHGFFFYAESTQKSTHCFFFLRRIYATPVKNLCTQNADVPVNKKYFYTHASTQHTYTHLHTHTPAPPACLIADPWIRGGVGYTFWWISC